MIDGWGISCEISLSWQSLNFTDDKSMLVQVMAWCRQATSHHLSHCWPSSIYRHMVSVGHNELNMNDNGGLLFKNASIWYVLTHWHIRDVEVFFYVYLLLNLQIDILVTSCEIGLWWVPQNSTDDIHQHWFRYSLGAVRQQDIPWADADPNLCCH